MTNQTSSHVRLGGSPAGITVSLALTLAAVLCAGGAKAVPAQEQPNAAAPQKPAEKKPAAAPQEKIMGGYKVHSMVELGGRFAEKDGSRAMWATMVNQTTGARVLSQSLDMHTLDPRKTPFFDTLSTSSFGYGGDPSDVSFLRLTKGRIYDFSGNFRRDRNYFDYNLLDNSLLSTATAATPALVPEPDSLHIFNTVRRNTDTLLTLLPVSFISFRAGFNHNTNEGPTYSTVHYAGDVQVAEWFRNSTDTYIAGVDLKVLRRTTLSYDQFLVYYKGDNMFHLAPTPYTLSNGTPVSLGVDVLTGPTVTCGSGKNKTENVVNGVVNPFCSATTGASSTAPIRTSFPTEQFRFSAHYWEKVVFNGRLLYSGGTYDVNHFNQTFTGYNSRTGFLQETQTGGMANGRLAENKRANTNGDFGMVAELTHYLSISDAYDFWYQRNSGNSVMNTQAWIAPSGGSLLTPISSVTPCIAGAGACPASPAANTYFLNQKIQSNTLLAEVTPVPMVKLSGGWRFVKRNIVDPGDDLTWHQNWLLLGGVIQPSPILRINVNYEGMSSKSANSNTTPANTYTREAPDKIYHFRARALVKPAKWINFAVATNDYSAKNDDPLVDHHEHNRDISLAAQVIATESLSFDFNYAHDSVYSVTDLCYAFIPNVNAPLPAGASNAGTCTVANSGKGVGDPSYYLGTGYYNAPANYFSGGVNLAPSKYFRINAGARVNSVDGSAEFLNPLQVPGALQSKFIAPYADLVVNIAPQWSWHGNWTHQAYDESGPAGPAPRTFHGDIYTLGVKHAF